jgi:hypothetical protein
VRTDDDDAGSQVLAELRARVLLVRLAPWRRLADHTPTNRGVRASISVASDEQRRCVRTRRLSGERRAPPPLLLLAMAHSTS